MRLLIRTAAMMAAGESAADIPCGDLPVKPAPEILTALAGEHGISGILRAGIRRVFEEAGAEPSPELIGRIEEEADRQAAASLAVCSDMARALDDLRGAGIEAMAFKGPALSALAYGDVTMRSFSDADIMVRRREATAAIASLQAAGWESRSLPPRRLWGAFVRHYPEVQMIRRDAAAAVDLHWEAIPVFTGCADSEEHIWRNSVEIAVTGRRVRTPGVEDHLLVACANGAKHAWGRLCWASDAMALAGRISGDRWPALIGRARSAGCAGMLRWGIAMCEALFGFRPPDTVAAECRLDRRLPALVTGAMEILMRRQLPRWTRVARLYCDSMDGMRDRLAFWLGAVFRPTEYEWRLVSLPPALFWIYGAIRPARLALKYASAPFARGNPLGRRRT